MPEDSFNISVDSKFRRETANFKVNIEITEEQMLGDDPVPLKKIEKGLKPEDLLGLVVKMSMTEEGVMSSLGTAIIHVNPYAMPDQAPGRYLRMITGDQNAPIPFLYYDSTTGWLSAIAPYEEEEESTPNAAPITVNPVVPGGSVS